MMPDARVIDRVTQVLAGTTAPGTFATRRVISTVDLHRGGVGPIPLPLSAAVARRLCEVARAARYTAQGHT